MSAGKYVSAKISSSVGTRTGTRLTMSADKIQGLKWSLWTFAMKVSVPATRSEL